MIEVAHRCFAFNKRLPVKARGDELPLVSDKTIDRLQQLVEHKMSFRYTPHFFDTILKPRLGMRT